MRTPLKPINSDQDPPVLDQRGPNDSELHPQSSNLAKIDCAQQQVGSFQQ